MNLWEDLINKILTVWGGQHTKSWHYEKRKINVDTLGGHSCDDLTKRKQLFSGIVKKNEAINFVKK